MKEFVALIVLSMPIIAVLCIGGLAGYAGWAAARRMEEPRKKWIARIIGAVTVILIFTWDEIAGRAYLSHLCKTEGGAKVYKQVRLPAEYWRTDGTPIFLDSLGNKVASRLDEDYRFGSESDEQYSRAFRIRQYVNVISDRKSAELLAQYKHFSFFGGWLVNYVSLDVAGTGCPNEANFYSAFLRTIFVR